MSEGLRREFVKEITELADPLAELLGSAEESLRPVGARELVSLIINQIKMIYKMCCGKINSELEESVNEKLKQGYVLHGSPFFLDFREGYLFQALVLNEAKQA